MEREQREKAAILTWCDNNGPTNYGQILQCYAMQRLVESWGYAPLVVQYRTKDKRDFQQHNFSVRHPIGRWLNESYEKRYNLKIIEQGETPRVQQFKAFIKKHIHLSTPCYTKEAVEYVTRACRLLVCGSDQIWNPLWFHPIWALDFGTKEQKRVAYAPSGVFFEDSQSVEIYKKMVPSLERLDLVTVREKIGQEILSKYITKEVKEVPDPTLLLSKEEWDKITAPRLLDEDYIFCYIMGSIRPYPLILRELMKKHKVKQVVYIPSNLLLEEEKPNYCKYEEAGPDRFLSLIKYAKVVCTDSFHGTVLAAIYEKPFYNVRRAHAGTEKFGGVQRINNLLEKLGISSRSVRNIQDVFEREEIDYKTVNQSLEQIRNHKMQLDAISEL